MTGLVLCGGQSARLGFPKMLIERDGLPLYQWWKDALAKVCKEVLISCNPEQTVWLKEKTSFITDLKASEGPLMGIYSAFRQHKTEALLVVSCELVYVGLRELEKLVAARDHSFNATAWMDPHTGQTFPLFTIYESTIIPEIENELSFGRRSPSRILVGQKVNLVRSQADFKGINTREDLLLYLSK